MTKPTPAAEVFHEEQLLDQRDIEDRITRQLRQWGYSARNKRGWQTRKRMAAAREAQS